MQEQYKFAIGDTLRIKDGIFRDKTFAVGEDDRRMSTGIESVPMYYYRGRWFFEWEVERTTETAMVTIGEPYRHWFDGDERRVMEITDIKDITQGLQEGKVSVPGKSKTFIVWKGRGPWYIVD